MTTLAKRGRPVPWLKLVKETSQEPTQLAKKIMSPIDIMRIIRPRAANELVEVFYVITLNTQNIATSAHELTRGILNSCIVHPREVFRYAIQCGACGIVVAHNHPSGNITPSVDDHGITKQLAEAGKLLDIPVYDHVIVTEDQYYSFAEAGEL